MDEEVNEPLGGARVTIAIVTSIDSMTWSRSLFIVDSTKTDLDGSFSIQATITDPARTVLSCAFPGYYEYDYYLERMSRRRTARH